MSGAGRLAGGGRVSVRIPEPDLRYSLAFHTSILSRLLNKHPDIHLVRVAFEDFQRHRNNSISQYNECVRHRVYDEKSLVYMRNRQPSIDISPLRASQASLPMAGCYAYQIRWVESSRGFFLIHLEENQRITHGKHGDKASPTDEEDSSSPQLIDRITAAPMPTLQSRLQSTTTASLKSCLSSSNSGQHQGNYRQESGDPGEGNVND
ncbi:hypothetical protein BDZ89DRAFT_1129559 [Hymenopellis radicata]|nr:hypothetical protein BDZ89DRAFT_1129559 [Hymenopellis radicata]